MPAFLQQQPAGEVCSRQSDHLRGHACQAANNEEGEKVCVTQSVLPDRGGQQ